MARLRHRGSASGFRAGARCRRATAVVGVVACVLMMSACSTFQTVFADRRPLSDRAVWFDVPFEAQKSSSLCGYAAARMLTGYYGVPLSLPQRQMLLDEAESIGGIRGATLASVLQGAGYAVAVFPGTLDRELTGLFRHLDHRRPLIVMLAPRPDRSNHYVLVTGYDALEDRVVLMDPSAGRRVVSGESFRSSWTRANQFTLLAVPASAGPVEGGGSRP